MFICLLLILHKAFSEKKVQEYHRSVKQFGSWSDLELFAKGISIRQSSAFTPLQLKDENTFSISGYDRFDAQLINQQHRDRVCSLSRFPVL